MHGNAQTYVVYKFPAAVNSCYEFTSKESLVSSSISQVVHCVFKHSNTMKSFSVAALALIAPVYAGLRFPCSTLTVQRLDPVVQPGALPAAHVHHIVGGNAFNNTMTGDVGARATCTTCQMADDFRYRTAPYYLIHISIYSWIEVTTGLPNCTSNPPQTALTNECQSYRSSHC